MSTRPIRVEDVLQLLRKLPPRDRLRVVVQALPELERDLSPEPAALDFWHGADMSALAERQTIEPADNLDALSGGWPEDESVEEFVATMREWRSQSPVVHSTLDG